MTKTCKGKCDQYKANRTYLSGSRYFANHKRCQVCCKFIDWEGIWCPCCNNRLRTKPRHANRKLKKIKCYLCNGIISFWGRIEHWMKHKGRLICVACFDTKNGIKCSKCGTTKSITYENKLHFFRPELNLTFCNKCYNHYRKEKYGKTKTPVNEIIPLVKNL